MGKRRNQLHNNRRARRAARKRASTSTTNETRRYPRRSTIMDAILPAMMAKRSIDMLRDASATQTVHLWGLACTDDDPASDVAYTVVDLGPAALRSPILDAAAGLINQLPGRQFWGFGLACWMMGELFSGADGIPVDALRAMTDGPMKDRPTADELCAAMVFDARGHSYNAVMYVHMPELGITSWHHDTLESGASTDEWARRFDAGVVSAHVWAAAISQDVNGNRVVLKRLRQRNIV
ncbi:hypothetical protein [Nocardia brasiliensis]|uniref:hypothetical protein n=1 Tax=Nocardia brasiliensis TaxID=37326 RepID=UPI002458CE42|nr:hypothetical protein [Nocardia brasiliensis]